MPSILSGVGGSTSGGDNNDVSAEDMRYLIENKYVDEEFDEEMMAAFEKFLTSEIKDNK